MFFLKSSNPKPFETNFYCTSNLSPHSPLTQHKHMTSLKELLTQEGFNPTNTLSPQTKEITLTTSISLPLHICNDRKNINCSNQKGSLTLSFQPNTERFCSVSLSSSETSNFKSLVSPDSRREGPPMNEVAIRAVIGILSDYIERYIKDQFFRKTIFEKCNSYLIQRRKGSESYEENETLEKMKRSLENIDKLVQNQGIIKKELKIKTLRNSIELLTIVASLNSNTSREVSTTCGIPNSHLSACAQLYMAIVYKLQKNNRVCARHLMQVFCDAPFLARTYLVPQFWEQFFLPHLLDLKIWYSEEFEMISATNECYVEKEKKIKYLRKLYNNNMDIGTIMYAVYYKKWLRVGTNEPPLPVLPLPSRSSNR